MILKNYYKIWAATLLPSSKTPFTVVNTSGASKSAYRSSFADTSTSYYDIPRKNYDTIGFDGMRRAIEVSYKDNSVILGTGNTAPSVDDYKLSGSIITGISSVVSATAEFDDEGVTRTSVWTVQNNNAEPITIGEIACVGMCKSSSSDSSGSTNTILIERTALDTPITIPAGGAGQVTYTIRMNYPVT